MNFSTTLALGMAIWLSNPARAEKGPVEPPVKIERVETQLEIKEGTEPGRLTLTVTGPAGWRQVVYHHFISRIVRATGFAQQEPKVTADSIEIQIQARWLIDEEVVSSVESCLANWFATLDKSDQRNLNSLIQAASENDRELLRELSENGASFGDFVQKRGAECRGKGTPVTELMASFLKNYWREKANGPSSNRFLRLYVPGLERLIGPVVAKERTRLIATQHQRLEELVNRDLSAMLAHGVAESLPFAVDRIFRAIEEKKARTPAQLAFASLMAFAAADRNFEAAIRTRQVERLFSATWLTDVLLNVCRVPGVTAINPVCGTNSGSLFAWLTLKTPMGSASFLVPKAQEGFDLQTSNYQISLPSLTLPVRAVK